MKKIVTVLLAASMLLATIGCGVNVKTSEVSASDDVIVRIGGLKGPTSMGLLFMKNDEALAGRYDISMATAADEVLPLMIKGELDIALIPANAASVLYNKIEGAISVIDVNTLGVLYVVSGDDSIKGINDLKGKTVYMTGKGTVPEYSFKYLLDQNGIADDVTLEFKSEPSEVAAILAQDTNAVGLLPQPFVTAACMQNDKLIVAFGLGDVWEQTSDSKASGMVTGVTVVRNQFLKEHPQAVQQFIENHTVSVNAINSDPATGASYAVDAGIVAKEPIAQKAIPDCSIVCITGDEMKEMIENYLQVLFDADASSIGGKLPGEEFYYINN